MRVAFLSHQWPGARMGGIGSAVRQTAAALASSGHDVHVFTLTLPADARGNIPPGVVVHEAPTLAERVQAGALSPDLSASIAAGGEGIYRLSIGWLLCEQLLQAHRHQPFDIVEAPEVEALALPILLNREPRLPVVTHLHCCTAIAHLGNDAPVGPEEHLIRGLEFAAIALADGRCAPTQRVVEITRQFMAMPDDVAIIPHPVRTAEHTEKAQAPGPDDAPVGAILFFGRIERLKGVETIAHALNVFLPRNPNARFRFVGPDTNTAPDRRSMIAHLTSVIRPDLHARVSFAGEVGREAMARELEASLFCVLPSLWENFSMACCEAMSAGRPVIVGAGTGSVEVVGDAGIVSQRGSADDLAHQMERVYRDDRLRRALGDRARQRVATAFAPAVVAEQRVRFYAQVIARTTAGCRDIATAVASLPPDTHAALLRAAVMMAGASARCTHTLQRTPGTRLLAILETLSRETGRPADVALYGAGKHTTRLMSEKTLWESRGHRVISIIDDHPRFADTPTFLDLPVRSVARALDHATHHPPIVLSTDTYTDAFWTQTAPLRARGVRVFRLYDDPI